MNYLPIVFGFFSLFMSPFLLAQQFSLQEGTVRALVVGVSDYKDDKIEDLRFAHRDAAVFKEFLSSKVGGILEDEHIKLLKNYEATAGKIIAGLDWLKTVSGAGDRVIIYFSGHGDVERETEYQKGFLLAHDAPAYSYTAGGVIPIEGLKEVIAELTGNDVEVIIITDACRAGNLAGQKFSGAQISNRALAEQFTKEVKILSCQPNEFSIEGVQWGDGRGAFSFHLVDGLYGLADRNNNLEVNLREIRNYLEEHVVEEVDPHKQNPMVLGDVTTRLTFVESEILSQILAKKEREQEVFKSGDRKTLDNGMFENTDTSILLLYETFLAALDKGNLMTPEGESANDLYDILIEEASLQPFHASMTRNLAAELQDEAQLGINDYLKSEPFAVEFMRQPDLLKFFKYPDFVARAAELLGDKHYIFKQLKAKEQFFRARRVMLENLLGRSSLAESVQQRLLCNYCYEGLQYDSLAPYLYAMLGHGRCNNQRIQHYKKVLELSPTWLQAYIWMAEERESQGQMEEALDWIDQLFEMDSTYVLGHKKKSQLMVLLGKYKEAVIAGEEALELDTTYLDQWYNDWLASAYVMIHEYEKFRDYRRNQAEELESRATIERQIRGVQYLVDLANFQLEAGNLEKAKTLFTQTLSLTTNAELLERARWGLGWIALAEGQLNEAEIKFLELQGSERLSGLGFTYLKRNQLQLGDSILHLAISQHINQRNSPLEGAEQIILEGNTALAIAPVLAPEIVHLYQLALDSFPLHVSLSYNLGKVYQIQIQDFKKAVKQYEQTLRLEEQYLPAYYSMSTSFASMKKRKKALEWLELALKEGYDDQRKIQIEPAFDKIRKTKKFQSLIMQYF